VRHFKVSHHNTQNKNKKTTSTPQRKNFDVNIFFGDNIFFKKNLLAIFCENF